MLVADRSVPDRVKLLSRHLNGFRNRRIASLVSLQTNRTTARNCWQGYVCVVSKLVVIQRATQGHVWCSSV